MTGETWYVWRQLAFVEGENRQRLLVPFADPDEYECPLDGLFETREKAIEYLMECVVGTLSADDVEIAKELILCVETVTPVADKDQPDLSFFDEGLEDEDEESTE